MSHFNPSGRPKAITPKIAERLIELIASGMENPKVCLEIGIAPSTLYLELARNSEFSERYRAAKISAVDAVVDRVIAIAEDALKADTSAAVAAHKLLADKLTWKASRIAPQLWGERAQVDVVSRLDPLDTVEIAKRLAFMEALAKT